MDDEKVVEVVAEVEEEAEGGTLKVGMKGSHLMHIAICRMHLQSWTKVVETLPEKHFLP